jgi:RNA ligase (TIGR02306 family)
MSSLLVPVTVIEAITPHNNADALELAQVLGWQLVVKKGEYHVGDRVVYFPPDTMLPLAVSECFGVTKYLSKGRIRCAKLRGEPSFGLVVKPDSEEWMLGENVADHYGATKYEPPLRPGMGDGERDHPLFVGYTDIENMRNFPALLEEGELVVLTEKIHGTNCRVSMIEGELMAGSKAVRRRRPVEDKFGANIYWFPFTFPAVRALIEHLGETHRQVILFGEVYGGKIQSFDYGFKGKLGFRAFDLLVDGHYLDWQEFVTLCEQFGVETVPVLAVIPFHLKDVKAWSEGKTTLMQENAHMREGVIVRPLKERTDPKTGRVILKYVSDSYLFGEKSDYTEQ